MSTREYLVYTDGSCKAGAHELRPGGWGYVIKPPRGGSLEGYGKARDTHAKTMEYQAVAEALAALPEGVEVRVFSDNQSLVETLQKKLRDYRTSQFVNVDVHVVDSIRSIDASVVQKRLTVTFQWIRSHNGNPGNERADALAAQGAREAKAESLAAR